MNTKNIIFTVIAVVFIVFVMMSGGTQKAPPTATLDESLMVQTVGGSKLNFSKISASDQLRIGEIMTGVIQNTIPVTSDISNEIRGILKKYNATDEEISDFVIYGPAFFVNYQKLFFNDALLSISSGQPVKSGERFNLEKEALSRGLTTAERIMANDEKMKLIAKGVPIAGADGTSVVFSIATINKTLSAIDATGERLKALFASTDLIDTKLAAVTSEATTAVVTTNKGIITLELYKNEAPKTVANFVKLANEGFYNGTRFHRVLSGFMIQGGDPNSKDTSKKDLWGMGGPGYKFADEINANSGLYQTGYKRGVIAMANSGPNTNGSQFFIMHQDYPLPPNYAIFGKVISGIETVDKIASVETTTNAQGEKSLPVEDMIVEKIEVK